MFSGIFINALLYTRIPTSRVGFERAQTHKRTIDTGYDSVCCNGAVCSRTRTLISVRPLVYTANMIYTSVYIYIYVYTIHDTAVYILYYNSIL